MGVVNVKEVTILAKLHKLLDQAKRHMDPGENVVCAIMGAYEGKIAGQDTTYANGLLVATDRRVIMYGAKLFKHFDMEVFPYSNISSVVSGKETLGQYVTIHASGNSAKLKWINDKASDVGAFVKEVQARIGKKAESPSATFDIADQIKKLAELKDTGILTEEEFQSKKTELLAKM